MSICQYAVEEIVDVVMVEVVGHTEAQVKVLVAYYLVAECKLYTLVGCLTYVLELIGVTCRSIDRYHHQDVLGGVPIEVQCTAEFSVPETEVNTCVTGNSGLPFQVRIAHHASWYVGVNDFSIYGSGALLPCILP